MSREPNSQKLSPWGPITVCGALLVLIQFLTLSAPGSPSPPAPGGLQPPSLPTPTPTPPCGAYTLEVSCGSATTGSTWAGAVIDAYSCSPRDESGPETVHAFTLPTPGPWKVTASLDNLTVDLDVFLLGPQTCDPNECIAFGDVTATVHGAAGGDTYYAVVDGHLGVSGDYLLEITCEDDSLVFSDGFESGDTAGWSN